MAVAALIIGIIVLIAAIALIVIVVANGDASEVLGCIILVGTLLVGIVCWGYVGYDAGQGNLQEEVQEAEQRGYDNALKFMRELDKR